MSRFGSVPHSNQATVANPFGITAPLSTAPLGLTEVAALVTTMGGPEEPVEKFLIGLLNVPALFEALNR